MKNEPFVIERVFNASVSDVWKAITDKDQMKQWYFDLEEFKPEVGFEFQFEGGKDGRSYLHLCKVTEVMPERKLTYSWRYEGYTGNSFVTFELFQEGEKTRLKLTHEGLETFPVENRDLAKENFMEGWNSIIGTSLKEFVEKDIIKKEITINAAKEKVWDILLNKDAVKSWVSAFGEGTYVDTTWQKGTEVLWKDKEGNVGAKGIIEKNIPASLLKVAFYDEIETKENTPLGEYYESYALLPLDDKTLLKIEAGPLPRKHVLLHAPLWDKAIENIKALAE